MITQTSSQRILNLHHSSDTLPSPCSREPNTSPTGHHTFHNINTPSSHHTSGIMTASASAPSLSYLHDTSSSLPPSTACRRVGSEPLSVIASAPAPLSPTLRRRASYTRRSQKAMHRAAIRRIITVSNQQQQQQQQKQQQTSTCRSTSAPQLPLCASDLSRLGVVTQAVLKDHPCLSSGRSFEYNGGPKHKHQQHIQSPPSVFSTPETIPMTTKRTKQPIPPSITTRRIVSASCSCPATTTTPTSISSNSTTYYSISSSSSPLHTANSTNTNTSIHSSTSLSSPSPFPASHPPSSSSCPNTDCSNNYSSTVTPFQSHADALFYSPCNNHSSPFHRSPSSTRQSGSTTIGRQHASYRHNKPRLQHSGPISAPVTTEAPWRALHTSSLFPDQEEDKSAAVGHRRHSAGDSVWNRIVQPAGETFFGRLRSGSTSAKITIAPREMIFKSQKHPPQTSALPTPPLSVTIQVPQLHRQQPRRLKSTRRSSADRDLVKEVCPQRSEFSVSIRGGDDDDASECFYNAKYHHNKECIQVVDVSSCHQSRWSPFGVTQTAAMEFTWPQHTIRASCSRSRPQGKSRRYRIGNDITVQRRPSLRPLQLQQRFQQQAQQHSEETYQPPPSRTQPETAHQRKQLSVRYMRYLSTKPLPVLSRSSSTSKSRKRSIGPATTTVTSRYLGCNSLLNKPLPPIPNAFNPFVGGFPLSKECLDGLFAPQDGYHEARSSMVGFEALGSSSHRESKQELHASLLPYGGGSKEAIDLTMVGAAVMAAVGGGGKQDLCDDGAPWVDGSESKEELIQTNTLTEPSTMSLAMSKDELLEPSEEDALEKSNSMFKDEINGQDEKSTHNDADSTKSPFSTTTASTTITKDSSLASTSNAYKSTSPTSVAALSLKRFESFRFPQRKSPIEKSSMARPRLHQYHHHNHHHSLPYNTATATATYAHHLSKAAFDAHHQPLTASDLVRRVHESISRSNSTSSAVSTTTPANSAFVPHNDAKPRHSLFDANITSFSPTIPQGSKESGSGGSSRRHEIGWVSGRYRRQMGQQRLLRRSESCSNISHHRSSLSFNSSKKALLSLQARRVNKPDAKVHLLPEILTTATTSPVTSSGPAASDDDGLLSGLETPAATAVLLDTARTATPHVLFCNSPALAPTSVAKIVATAGMASAAVDYPHDNTDYQLRVSEQDRVVINSILTELSGTETFPSQTKTPNSDDVVVDSMTLVPALVDATKFEQGADSTKTAASAEASEITPKETPAPLSETNLPTALIAFKIESGPVIDAGEIKRFVKRSHALQELETTEQSYVNDLDVLVHVHLRVLETKSWFNQNVHANMRRCVTGLLALHRNFLSQIQAYKTSETDYEKRAPLTVYSSLEVAFQALSRDHRLYSQFCEVRMRTVNEINRAVGQSAITGMQKESKELMAQQGRPNSRTDLKDQLIKPIQRICRYPLLLKEILRLTGSGDPEYEFIDRAYECMKALAQQMDENQRITERKLLTEQFLKKLPETNFPRKSSIAAPLHSAGTLSHSNSTGSHHQYNHHRQGSGNATHPLPSSSAHGPSEELFEGGPFGEGILPGSLSKAYASTLGSIVLAGALEYVIMPDMPIRLRYYGCFLFESMLLVVKAKKMSLYEPRQWLPLRLCELYETTRLDGYTRFGWRIMYDQFRIDFGASCEAERQAWMTALRTHIQAARLAHARIPQNAAAPETVVSSLPWNMARPSALLSSSSMGSLVASGSTHQIHVHHQPPSPTPSPWSTCSSAIPSPLMPPPPLGTSSTSSTMMMAMSFMTSTGEPEKWNDRGTSGVSLDAYAQYYEQHIHPHSHEPTSAEPYDPSRLALTHHLSVESNGDTPHGYGMAGNQPGNNASHSSHQDQSYNPLNRSLSQPRTRPSNEFNPLSAKKSESAASGAGHLLFPSTPFPWLVPDPRPRNHSFDVTRVFASSHSGIKPNQRTLVQSMFKDVSTENIWTTTTTVTAASYHSQHSPQPVSANLSSPMTSRAGRHSTPMPFSYFHSNSASSPNTAAGNAPLLPLTSPKAVTGMVASTSGHSLSAAGSVAVSGAGEDDETPASTTTLQSAGSCSSLTSRLMRRKNSGTSAKSSLNGLVIAPSEKTEWDRRRNSATAAIAATLNFRKNFDPNTHNHVQHHRRRLSIPDLFNNNGDHPAVSGVTPPTRDGGSIYQWISVKARAQVIEKKATHGLTPSFASAPLLAGSRNKSKKGGGLAGGRLKASQSSQDLSSSFVVDASSSPSSLASLAMPGTGGESLATSLLGIDLVADSEILNGLSSAAGEAAQFRRGNGSSERIQRRSLGAALTMTSIDHSSSTAVQSSTSSSTAITSTTVQGLRPSNSTQSLPVYLESNNSSTHSLVDSQAAGDSAHKDSAVEKIWMAMGRLTHRRSAGDRRGSSSSNKSHQRQHQQHQGYTQASNQSSGSIVGEGGDKTDVAESPHPLRRSSIHASDCSSLTMVYNSGDASPVIGSFMAHTNTSGRSHYRTVSGSTIQSMDSATSITSNGSVPNHQDMISSSPSSVPRLTLTPSGSNRSRSSSNSSVHSSLLSIHDQPKSNDLHYQHHHHNKPQHPDTRQSPLPWSFSEDHNDSENALTREMAVGTSSPRSTSTSSCHHSGGSGSRKSISSSSASSLSPTLHYNQDPYQLQPSVLHDRSSSATKVPISFQEGYTPVPFPHTPHLDPSIQDRRKPSSILQNLTQASQKFKTMIRPPAGMRRRTVMNIPPITIEHHNSGGVAGSGMSIELRSDGTGVGVLTELLEDEIGSMGLSGGEIDVGPLVSESDMEEIFGVDRVADDAG